MVIQQALHVSLLFWGCIFNLAATLCMLLFRNFNREKRRWMLLMQLSAVLLLGGDMLAWLYDGRAGEVGYWLVRISNFIVYGAVDIALICFNGYLCSYLYSAEERKRAIRPKLVLAIGVLSLLLVAISQHSSMYYYFDDKNVYHRTWSYMISVGLPLCGMLLDLSMLVQRRHSVSKELFVSLASFIAFPVAAGIIQVWFYNFSLVGMSIGISMILMFLVMTVEQNWEIEQLEQSNAETTERLEIATTLNQCVKELSGATDISKSIDNLLEIIGKYFSADRTYVFEFDYEKNVLNNTYEYVRQNVTRQQEQLQGVPMDVISTWMEKFLQFEPYYIPDLEQEKGTPTYDMLVAQNIDRLLAVPLMREGVVIGFMGVDNPREHYSDPALLSSIRFFISNSLDTKVQQERLRYLSYRDTLTKLYNRNQYMKIMESCARSPLERVGAAYLDINGLKEINDSYGHEAGDQMIRSAAQVLMRHFPEQAYRVGGDEFVLIAPEISESLFHDKIRAVQEEMQHMGVSIATGALWEEGTNNLEALLKRADQLMYAEKEKFHRMKTQKGIQA